MKKRDFDYVKKEKKSKNPLVIRTKNYEIPWYYVPISPILIICDKIRIKYERYKKNKRKRLEWNATKAKDILDYYLPNVLNYDIDSQEYTFYIQDSSDLLTNYDIKQYVPRKYRVFADKFRIEIANYLVNEYEKDGYTKNVEKIEPFFGYEPYNIHFK